MRENHGLTARQRRIIAILTIGALTIIGLLIWSVWSTMQTAPPLAASSSPTKPITILPTAIETPLPTLTAAPTEIPTFDVATAGQIAAKVAEVRGFQGFWSTPLTLVDEYNLSVALYRHYEIYPPFVTQADIIWKVLHLRTSSQDENAASLPSSLDVVSQADKTAAIYLPQTEEYYFRRDWAGKIEVLETQLVYGYARALPDQYGNITQLIAEATSLDRRLALIAAADGDALLTLWLYAGIEQDANKAGNLKDIIAQGMLPLWKKPEETYAIISRLPLELGGAFALALFKEEGIQALDDVIIRPPRSTEQILHIDKYLESDEPQVLIPVDLPLGRDWSLQATETLGEALIGLTLEKWSMGEYSLVEAENWGGDLLQVWDAEDGSYLALWQIALDSSGDAATFYGNLLDLLPRPLLRGIVNDTTASAGLPRGRWWAGGQGAVFIYRRSNRIVLVWGNNSLAVENAAISLN